MAWIHLLVLCVSTIYAAECPFKASECPLKASECPFRKVSSTDETNARTLWHKSFLEVLAEDTVVADYFDPHFRLIVNNVAVPGSSAFAMKETWTNLYSKIKLDDFRFISLYQVSPNRIVGQVQVVWSHKKTGEKLTIILFDDILLDENMKTLEIQRVVDEAKWNKQMQWMA